MKRIALLLALSLTAGMLSGFSAIPPENWEKIDPEFHLTPPTQESEPDTFPELGEFDGIIVEPTTGEPIITVIPVPAEEIGPQVVLLQE